MLHKLFVATLSVNALLAASCCNPITREEVPGLYDNNFFVEGDFLYWYAKQEGNQFAYTGVAEAVPGTINPFTTLVPVELSGSGHVYEPKYEMKPGFRAGVGINLVHDKWDLFLDYTYFDNHSKGLVSSLDLNTGVTALLGFSPAGSILEQTLLEFDSVAFLHTAKAHWGLFFNTVNLELGRMLQFTPIFGLRPHFGLEGSWQKQNLHVEYDVNSLSDVFTQVGKNRVIYDQTFWGIGPRVGIDSYWSCFQYLGLFANSALATLWGQFDVHTRSFDTNSITNYNDVLIVDQKFSPHTICPVVQLELGAQFDWMFRNCRSMMFQLGWEGQVWFSQNRYTGSVDDALVLQGLTFKAKFGY